MTKLRRDLIQLCYKSIVPIKKWHNRDSPSAQAGVGKVLVLLTAGARFKIRTTPQKTNDMCVSNKHTLWIDIEHYEFEEPKKFHTYYLPTLERLKEANGEDWY